MTIKINQHMTIKILGKIKNRWGDVMPFPNDIWTNSSYRIRLDETGDWIKISNHHSLAMASVVELGICE